MSPSSQSAETSASTRPTPIPGGLQVLLDASAMLLASRSVSAVLSGIVDLARQLIAADAYAVWRTYDASNWRVLASHGLSPLYRTEFSVEDRVSPILQAVPDVTADPSLHPYLSTYETEGIRSLLVVPLKLQDAMPDGPNAGTITFYWRTPRTFSGLDVAYASALANLSAAALNISELHEENQRERGRLTFLADASAVLTSSLDYEITLQQVAHLAVPHIADWCTVHILEDGVPNRLVVAHADPAQLRMAEEFSRRYPEQILPDRGLGLVLRTGKTEVHPMITDQMLVLAASDNDHLRALRQMCITSSIVVPISSHGKILGAIRLLAAGGDRSFDQDDVQLAELLARRAAMAVENARLHRAVLDQENRLRLAHSAASMGTWTWDLLKQKLNWSDECKQLYGLSPDTEPGAEFAHSLIHPDDREGVANYLAEVFASDATQFSTEHRAILPDGRLRWIHSRARIERDADANAVGITGISMDITERRQAEDALRRTEKLAAAGRLAATVAHEINNPLEAIFNLIYIAKMTAGMPEEATALLVTAEGELSRMAQIVRQTLGFYRESVNPRNSDIGRIVSELLELYRSRVHARSLNLDVDLDPNLSAHVIPGEIKQVVANLIANAIDATAPKGRIHISVKRAQGNVAIAIRDTGTGIEDVHRPHLFEPFFTTKSDVGTGLGLWVSKGIVEKHNGTISIASSTQPGAHGTTVTVTLPLA